MRRRGRRCGARIGGWGDVRCDSRVGVGSVKEEDGEMLWKKEEIMKGE